jgi:hypothetical protein
MQHLQALSYVLQTKDLLKRLSPLDVTLTKNTGGYAERYLECGGSLSLFLLADRIATRPTDYWDSFGPTPYNASTSRSVTTPWR